MRVYHLMHGKWAIEALKTRRIKVSLIEDMNDPFELLGVSLTNKEDRIVFRKLRSELNTTIGVLCFSRSWENPVLWSHYGDRHRGLCLGFDVLDDWVKTVSYQVDRLKPELEQTLGTTDVESFGLKLLTTKFEHWRYEDEIRIILNLKDMVHEPPHYFLPFCNALQLKEIIAGSRCELSQTNLSNTFQQAFGDLSITQARLAFQSFKVVADMRSGRSI